MQNQTHRPAEAAAQQPSPEAYRAALAAHDWYFEFSDDHSVYCRGRDSLARITSMRRAIDPDGATWRQYAPEVVA